MLGDPIYWIIIGFFMLLSWGVGQMLQHKMKKYSGVRMSLTGKDIAERMLRDKGISGVKVISTPGQLTDHYNPANRTVNLSDWVYAQNTLAAAAVAAHECGHAIQHAKAWGPLKMRSKLVPAVSVSSKITPYLLMGGLFLAYASGGENTTILLAAIVLFSISTLFTFVTLPVEFDASRRALAWLDSTGVTRGETGAMAKDALNWAAMTYVVAALASLGQLLYYVMLFARLRR